MDGPTRIEKTVWINPSHVVAVERDNGITCIETTTSLYYTTVLAEIVLQGVSDVHQLNAEKVRLN